jgi:hypothetical protein
MKKILPFILILLFLYAFPALAIDLQTPIGANNTVSDLGAYIKLWYKIIIGSIGVLAATLIIWGGFQWLTAAGNSTLIDEAKKTIIAAIVGLLIALISYSFLYIINPNFLTLSMPDLPKVNTTASNSKTGIQKYCCACGTNKQLSSDSEKCTGSDGSTGTVCTKACSTATSKCGQNNSFNTYYCQ